MADSSEDSRAAVSRPREELASWANDRDSWIRLLISTVMANNGPLSESQVQAIHEHLLLEKHLAQGDFEELTAIAGTGATSDKSRRLTLRNLDRVKNVNALVPEQSIQFSDQLTVLFGQNASGKTGYTRIIKRMANVRRAEEVLTNAKEQTASATPSAHMTYALDDDETDLEWNNELGVEPLTRISVFDTRVLDMHVDEGIGYVYTPSEIALFGHASEGLIDVQDRVSAESRALSSGGKPFLARFTVGSNTYTVIEQLSAATDTEALTEIKSLSAEEEAERQGLQLDLPALQGGTLATVITSIKRQIRVCDSAAAQLAKLEAFDRTEYNSSLARLDGARQTAEAARTSFASHPDLPDELDDEWQTFILAGDHYQRHVNENNEIVEDDPCPYCRVPLNAPSLQLVNSYRTFLEDSLQKAVANLEQEHARLCGTVDPATSDSLVAEMEALRDDGNTDEQWIATTLTYLAEVSPQVTKLKTRLTIDEWPINGPKLQSELSTRGEQLGSRLQDLEKDAAESDQQIATKTKRLRELTDRITFEGLRPQIEAHLQGLKRSLALAEVSKRITTTRTSLTELSKIVSSGMVNSRFEELFEEECKALRAPPDVTLKFPGESGKAKRQKQVASRKPSDILSEGEQKVIGLADFLAECRMREIKAPIIFDDPVTSLDYRRLEEVAKRVSDLADQHQVIVFTHNISFATALIDLRKSSTRRCSFFRVEDDGERKGIVSADVEPSLDSPKTINKQIRECLERAEGLDDDRLVRDALVNNAIDLLRRWLEAFVEQDLLAGIAKRHRPNLQLGNLEKIKAAKLPDALSIVANAFNRTSRHIAGHSKTDEQINVAMTRAEVETLWTELNEVRTEFIKG